MRQILYLTENRALKTAEFELGADISVTFKEKAFIISVIWLGNVLTPRLDGLTALEKYAMSASGFDYLILTDGDFRLENTTFVLPDNWAITAMPANGNPTQVAESSAGGVSPLFPIYRNGLEANKCIQLLYTSMGEVFNANIGDFDTQGYIYNSQFENTTVQVFGCIYFLSSHKMPENIYIYINPKTGEFMFSDFTEWTEVHFPQYTTWSVNKGYIRVFKHSEGNHIFLSTTPFDVSISTVLPS